VKKQGKFLIAASAILLTLSWLAWVGATESQTYYHTIAELNTLTGSKAKQRMRIGGDIRSGSIQKLSGRVDFVIEQEGHALEVSYVGKDPLPDTFVDGAQAVVEGRRAADGRFVAEQVQAKCASKYEAKPGEARPGYGSPDSEKPAAPSPGGVKKS
jgi:cytochrome c-type biogenesis protein CcmE